MEWVIIEKRPKVIREELVKALRRYPKPLMSITKGGRGNREGLYLFHHFEEEAKDMSNRKDVELDIEYLHRTSEHLYFFWGNSIWLETKKVVDNRSQKLAYIYDGKRHTTKNR